MAKMSKRQRRAYDDLIIIEQERKKYFRRLIGSAAIILLVVALKIVVEASGLFPQVSFYLSTASWVVGIILAFFVAGPASISLTKSKNTMNSIIAKYQIDEDDFKAYKRGELE